jgi:hypothetical protein
MSKVYCVGMIKNEADIIESYVRYHLNIFDGMVLLDISNLLNYCESLAINYREMDKRRRGGS